MPNLNVSELMRAIIRIRDNIDKVEVKGHVNRELLVSSYNDCNELLKQLGIILDEIHKIQNEQSSPELKEVTFNETDENT